MKKELKMNRINWMREFEKEIKEEGINFDFYINGTWLFLRISEENKSNPNFITWNHKTIKCNLNYQGIKCWNSYIINKFNKLVKGE